MAKATQDERLLSISTSLGKDYLLLNRLEWTESISKLFEFRVQLLVDESESTNNRVASPLDLKGILGQGATISIDQNEAGVRYLNGMFNSIAFAGRDEHFTYYNATIVPQIWQTTQVHQSRIFQNKNIEDILKTVLTGFKLKFKLQGTYKPRNYCVQYNETDFDFISRLMEEEGICYYFEFSSDSETMVIADNFQPPQDCPNKHELGFHDEELTDEIYETAVKSWFVDYRLQTGKVTYWDHNFQLPKKRLEVTQASRFDIYGNNKLEVYNYPAGYSRKYDGISKDGGEQASDLQNIFEDNRTTAKNRAEALDAGYRICRGVSDCSSLTAGHRFYLKNHPNSEYNGQYILTSVSHKVDQSPKYYNDEAQHQDYSNSFTCIAHGSGNPIFRPLLETPKPIIYGSQTAVIVGPPGEEIFTDKYGRVKVQFHWDRFGQANSDSSCWVRVAQTWAGNKWGAMFIPRIGMEVVVNFLEGDPDQPLITGCVFNADNMPPYTLPDEKTKSTLKSNSSKGGGGFNEFRIEDKKGEEQIFLHGEKDLDIRIKNDAKELIQNDRHLIVQNSQFEEVKTDKHLKVVGNHNEEIGSAMSLKVGSDYQIKTGPKFAVDASSEIHLKSGMSLTLETGTNLTLKVGSNFININSGGIFIKGTMVMLNSGGAAGSGGGSNPTSPTAPKEAVNAEAGSATSTMTKPPPTTPTSYSPKAAAMKEAAKKGTPLVSKSSPPSNSPASPGKKKSGGSNPQQKGKQQSAAPPANKEKGQKGESQSAQQASPSSRQAAHQAEEAAKKRAEEAKKNAQSEVEKAKAELKKKGQEAESAAEKLLRSKGKDLAEKAEEEAKKAIEDKRPDSW